MNRQLIEGDSYSKLTQLIGYLGYNKDVDIELGTVTAAPPNIKIVIDGMRVELDADDLIIPDYLLEHTRDIMITGDTVITGTMTVASPLQIGRRVIVANYADGQRFAIVGVLPESTE